MTLDQLKEHEDYKTYFADASEELLEKFFQYHSVNEPLWKLFQKFAVEAHLSNRPRFSIWMIANRIRWYTQVETKGIEFKVSNDYLAVYARLLMVQLPQLKGIFQVKRMKKDRVTAKH